MKPEFSLSFEIIKTVMALGLAAVVTFFAFMLVVVARVIWRALFPVAVRPVCRCVEVKS